MDDRSYASDVVSEVEDDADMQFDDGEGDNSTSQYMNTSGRGSSPRSLGEKSDDYSYSFDDDEGSLHSIKEEPYASASSRTMLKMNTQRNAVSSVVAPSRVTSHHPTSSSSSSTSTTKKLKSHILNEIGSEVMVLRDQQRSLLKTKLKMAKEKKERAEQRRDQYNREQQDMLKEISSLKQENRQLQTQTEIYNSKAQTLEQTLTQLRKNLQKSMDNEDQLSKDVVSGNTQLANLQRRMTDEKNLTLKDSQNFSEEKMGLMLQVNELRVQLKVQEEGIRKQMTAWEKQRQNLPEHYKQLLAEKLQVFQDKEDEMVIHKRKINEDNDNERKNIETFRQEALQQSLKNQEMINSTLKDERRIIQSRWKELENEREHHITLQRREQAAMEARRVDLGSREQQLEDKERNFEVAKQRFENEVGLIEPRMQAIRDDLERARVEREAAEKVRQNVDDYASSIVEGEKSLRRREEAMVMAMETLERNKTILIIQSRNLAGLKKAQQAKQDRMNREHFKLHLSAMELSHQFAFLRSALRKLRGASGMNMNLNLTNMHSNNSTSSNSIVVHSDASIDPYEEAINNNNNNSAESGGGALSHHVVVDMMSKVEGAYNQLTQLISSISELPDKNKENHYDEDGDNDGDGDGNVSTANMDDGLSRTLDSLGHSSRKIESLSHKHATGAAFTSSIPPPPPDFSRGTGYGSGSGSGGMPNTSMNGSMDDALYTRKKSAGTTTQPSYATSLEMAAESAKALKSAATRSGFF